MREVVHFRTHETIGDLRQPGSRGRIEHVVLSVHEEISVDTQLIELAIRLTVALLVIHSRIHANEWRTYLSQSIQFVKGEGFSTRSSLDLSRRKNIANDIERKQILQRTSRHFPAISV